MILSQFHKKYVKQNLLAIVSLILLSGLLLCTAYMQFSTARQADNETRHLGKALAQHSDILIRPLLLSDDKLSLNYLLNELKEIPYIQGLQVASPSGVIIARAGNLSDIKLQQRLIQQERTIAIVTLWLTPTPLEKILRNQFWPISILALTTILLTLWAIWLLNTKQANSQDNEFESDNKKSNQLSDLSFSDSLAIQNENRQGDTIAHTPSPFSESSTNILNDTQHTLTEQNHNAYIDNDQKEHQLHTESLVDLLKPEHDNSPQIPKFEHHPQDLEASDQTTQHDEFSVEEELINDAEAESQSTTTKSANPLFNNIDRNNPHERKEVQLGLYSFEDELELLLAPQDAIYLFYIDSTTASSDNMDPDEKATLLNVYLHLAKQVARIYNGEPEQLENNDILLRFELRDDKDSHGINAICAAMLFSLLYKGFNQARIKGFQPVLSLQMSLSRGRHDKYSLVKEEAHFLTLTTNSNEVISHTALTEAPFIKDALLKQADIRREDEDKVLLLKITPQHQALLQKQANHLLTKIFKK